MDGIVMTGIWLVSSISDLKEYQIRNQLILFGWLTGLAFRFDVGGLTAVKSGVCSIVLTILIAWPLFRLRAMGAGDVKLFSVVAGFYGLHFLWQTVVLFSVFAGSLSLYRLLHGGMLRERFQYLMLFTLYGRAGIYYLPKRDGREVVISMAPLLALAYYGVRLGVMDFL